MHANKYPNEKLTLHPRNLHRNRYDFPKLIESSPALEQFVSLNKFDDLSIDFADPLAVKALNKALLNYFYHIEQWDIPEGYLCPPIPGRADYIHNLADLLSRDNKGVIPQGSKIRGLDIGTGANCIYPIIGHISYGWRFVGTDIDPISVQSAKWIISANLELTKAVQIRQQKNTANIFKNIIKPSEHFDFVLCNPPFHASQQEADEATQKKLHNLGKLVDKSKPLLNFGGSKTELWCHGGEVQFTCQMAIESAHYDKQCLWFSTLVSKKTTLPTLYQTLKNIKVREIQTIDMAQGQKSSRIVLWTFLNKEQRNNWAKLYWHKP